MDTTLIDIFRPMELSVMNIIWFWQNFTVYDGSKKGFPAWNLSFPGDSGSRHALKLFIWVGIVDLLDYNSDFLCLVYDRIRRLRTKVQITVYEILFD